MVVPTAVVAAGGCGGCSAPAAIIAAAAAAVVVVVVLTFYLAIPIIFPTSFTIPHSLLSSHFKPTRLQVHWEWWWVVVVVDVEENWVAARCPSRDHSDLHLGHINIFPAERF